MTDGVFRRYRVEVEEGLDNILVVDGIPVVDKSKLEKLLTKISKEFGKRGAHIKPDDIFVPWDDVAGKSKGYASYQSSTVLDLTILCLDLPSWSSERQMTHLSPSTL